MYINGLILAAGLSSRLGEFKPLLPLCGKTVIENTIDSMLISGVNQIVLVTGHRGEEVEEIIKNRYIENTVICTKNIEYASTDMLASIKIGLKLMPKCKAFFLLPGDMPVIGKDTYLSVYRKMSESNKEIVFPLLKGKRKHPPLIKYSLIHEILKYEGQGGLRELWKHHEKEIGEVAVNDRGCKTDLDTYEEYIGCINYCKEKEINMRILEGDSWKRFHNQL